MPQPRTGRFAETLRHILVTEKRARLIDVAHAIGMEPRNFYGRVNSRVQFSPEEAAQVLAVVPDARLADALLADSPFIAVARPDPGWRHPGRSALQLAAGSIEEVARALREVAESPGERPDDATAADIIGHLDEAQRLLGALRLLLRDRPPRGAPGAK